jgi:hypothetical protein
MNTTFQSDPGITGRPAAGVGTFRRLLRARQG